MAFDIHALDEAADADELVEGRLGAYIAELMELFTASPEGQARLALDSEMGWWAYNLVQLGYDYQATTLSKLEVNDVEKLLQEIFPRKLTITSADETLDALPELIAFWEYLGREYQLPNAQSILRYLRSVKPETFRGWMTDQSRFGSAKTLVTSALAAGVDPTDTAAMDAFVIEYNARLKAESDRLPGPFGGLEDLGPAFLPGPAFPPALAGREPKRGHAAKAKKQRKMAAASRKKNRRRK